MLDQTGHTIDPSGLPAQLDRAAAVLEAGLAQGDLTEFYDLFRSSDLPYVALLYEGDPCGVARACCDVVHRLGGVSPAVGLAVENHLYVTAAMATFPAQDARLEELRRSILERMSRERLLIANTNSRVHADKLGTLGTQVRREGDGFLVTGSAAYMSLATQSDLLIFLTRIEDEGPAVFLTSLRGNPGVEIGPFLFPRAMLDSDTRRVTFHDLRLAETDLVMGGRNENMLRFIRFQLSWHQLLISALYLGAAARAIEEVRAFLRSVRAPDGRPLAELDGMIVDTGRLVLRYRTAWELVQQTARALGELARGSLEAAPLDDLFDLACTAKHTGTTCAEDVVTAARRIIGARSFAEGHPLERLSQETMFGPLGPEVNAAVERRLGQRALADRPSDAPKEAPPTVSAPGPGPRSGPRSPRSPRRGGSRPR